VISLVLTLSICYIDGDTNHNVSLRLYDNFIDFIDFTHLCEGGIPLLLENDRPKPCSPHPAFSALQCPNNFWCHLGSTNTTNYCCPKNRKVKNRCHLPPTVGLGRGKMRRYAYDLTSGLCKELIYTGYGGNENNFLTITDCQRACLNSPPSAFSSISYAKINSPRQSIKAATYAFATQSTSSATIASSPAPKISLSKKLTKSEDKNPCELTPDRGSPKQDIPPSLRWYYDVAATRCMQFHFLGSDGNGNNFEREHMCMEVCGTGSHNISSCFYPLKHGFGLYEIPRYFFNHVSRSCEQFIYAGYGGNENRFITAEECRNTCVLPIKVASTSMITKATTTPLPQTSSLRIEPFLLSPEVISKITSYVDAQKERWRLISQQQNLMPIAGVLTHTMTSIVTTTEPSIAFHNLSVDTTTPPSSALSPITPKAVTSSEYPTLINGFGELFPLFTTPSVIVHRPQQSQEQETVFAIAQNASKPFAKMFAKFATSNVSMPVDSQLLRRFEASLGQIPGLKYPSINTFNKPLEEIVPPTNLETSMSSIPSHGALVNVGTGEDSFVISPCIEPNPSGTYVHSCASKPFMCPQGTFCQIGAASQQSVCCPVISENQCTQPHESGTGNTTLGRWYYDAKTNLCKTFVFNGFKGNQNNFLSFYQCQQACGARNPCTHGEPLMQNDVRQRCSPTSSSSCPANHYCHISDGCLDTAVCCPMNTLPDSFTRANSLSIPNNQFSRCNMKADIGNGITMMQRWAYNFEKRICERFLYSGNGGNANNFMSFAECVQACSARESPCGSGFPLMDGEGFVRCGPLGASACPGSHYCHIGNNEETTVCCPLTGLDRCELPLSIGSGSSVLHRYYFDTSSSICRAFTYTGVGGNENNFLSLTECRLACPEYDNPCPSGKPFVNNMDGNVAYCTAMNPSCPTDYWCHIGETRQTSVCCPAYGMRNEERQTFNTIARRPAAAHAAGSTLRVLFPEQSPSLNMCSLPVQVGNGAAQLPRFFYNANTRTCQPFIYSGKGGNQNNFISKVDCEEECPVLDNPCSNGFPATDSDGEPIFCSTATPYICGNGYYCHIGATAATTLCCPGVADPCEIPMARGNGNSILNRWYFNSESRVCVSFVYSGRGGNSNNFLSRQDCLKQCPEYRSPCPEGHPHIGLSGQITHCGASGPSICPTTYWCHVGATLEESVCCPGAADPCEQKLQLGTGTARLHRFYYNQLSRTCQQFQYSGVGGNENNFLTLSACESRCPVFRNPCAFGQPQLDESLNVVMCSAADDSICAADYFCHIGDEEQTTVCCPGRAENMCMEPLVSGTGEAALNRFAYNALTRQCLPFVYSGIGGNQNNFLSKASCEASCPVLGNPCSQGDPATGANGQYIMCSSTSSNVCPVGYWCHIGADITASLCCPGAENPCALPLVVGTGMAHVGRWYFDVNSRRCSRFTYTGFGGNQNNFQTLQECRTRCPEFQNPCSTGDPAQSPSGGILFCSSDRPTCPASYWCHIGSTADSSVCCPSFGDPCLVAVMPGTGSAKLMRWHFNQNTRQCLQFVYTGMGGNENNFESELACSMKCPVFHSPCPGTMASSLLSISKCSAQNPYSCPSGHWCHVGGTPETTVCCPGAGDPCQLPVSQGVVSGMGPFTRWFYDRTSRICKPFQYTGIGGNENNFLTKEDCSAKCPEFSNPCYTGDPLRDLETKSIRYCDPNSPFSCPNNYYCHVGENSQTTVCCPGSADPCNSPLAIGSGSSALPRWYFNSRSRKCQQFTYTGVGGNSNNFLSLQQCSQACPGMYAFTSFEKNTFARWSF
uniref:BPTI/Kunitz inhibitor domain-containing protein n=2 Tax=Parascaris univalens TaxID=6257 RepID=A0A915ADW0_PARUN